MEKHKQESLEEASWRYNPVKKLDGEFIRQAFKEGASWQSKRMYSEEEAGELVYNIIGEYAKHYGIMIDGAKLNDLIEQFKKK